MAVKRKFYAVAVGRVPGIYSTWSQARRQVDGFAGARYKGFVTYGEAAAWLAAPEPKCPPRRVEAAGAEAAAADVIIYTDGGALNNPGPGGYGVVQLCDGEQREFTGGFRLTTNNRMELMACIVALRELEWRDRLVRLYSDSSYVVNGINRGWAKGWRQRGWRKADRQPAVNPDLWEQLLDLVEGLQVTFHWVRGHAGNPMNERCDRLAVGTARQPYLPVDEGYEQNRGGKGHEC